MVAHNKFSQHFVEEWCKTRNIELLDQYVSTQTKHRWYCPTHDTIQVQMFDKIKHTGRLKCCSADKNNKLNKQRAVQIANCHNMTVIDGDFSGAQKRIRWRCNVHGQDFYKTLHLMEHLKDKRMPCCKRSEGQIVDKRGYRVYTTLEVQQLSLQLGYQFVDDEYKGTTYRHQWYCPKHDKTYTTTFQSLYNKKRLLRCCAGELRSGDSHPNYNPHIDDKQRIDDRRSDKNKQWSLSVRERDSFCCQVCGYNQRCVAHHLDSYLAHPDKRYEVDNGITLCRECHSQFHRIYGHRKTTKEQFYEFLTTHQQRE